MTEDKQSSSEVTFTKAEILSMLDLAFLGKPNSYYPTVKSKDVKYNFFLDLEHGYCETVGSRIHLYSDESRWAIVFEKSGYQNRGTSAEIELTYVGNCINYNVERYPERNYISNTNNIIIITPDEFERIENKTGTELETFELIDNQVKEITIRNTQIPFESDHKKYTQLGIEIKDYENPRNLIGFADFLRYINEVSPELISASENEILEHIPSDLQKVMIIEDFHFISAYETKSPPSIQETYQMIADVLVTKDISAWKPTKEPNNHWSNWESGQL